tara:strand:- start:1086 stop:2708 length:1623 start_codon:yes stop_codon:yes gene_type:complete
MSLREELLKDAQADRQANIKGIRRAVTKGLTFGFNDEIEAKLKSVFNDEDYETIVQGIRQEEAEFKETGPQVSLPLTDETISAATLLELAGSIPTSLGGAGFLGKIGVKGLGKIGAVEGGIYGAGDTTAETGLGQAADVVTSSLVSGGLSKAGDVIMPVAKKGYDTLIRRGVEDITPGQAYKGLDVPEQSTMYTTPMLGPLISERRADAQMSFTQKLFEEAVEGLNISIPTGSKNKMYETTYDAISKKYDDLTKNTSFTKTQNFESKIDDIVNKAVPDGLPDADALRTKYKNELNAYLLKLDGSGNTFKSVDSSLAKVGRNLAKSQSDDTKNPIKQQIFNQTRDVLRDEFRKQNGDVAGDTLDLLDHSFYRLKILESAASRGKSDFITSSNLDVVQKQIQRPPMSSKGKNKYLTGNLPFSELKDAGKILENLGTSNTPALQAQNFLQNPASIPILSSLAASDPSIALATIPMALGGISTYADRGATNLVRRGIKPVGTAISKSLQTTSPFMGSAGGGLLGLRDDDIERIKQISALTEMPP